MKVKKRQGMLVITTPLIDPPKKSKSGKRLVAATSHGPRRTSQIINGQNLVVNFNAYIRPDGYVKGAAFLQRVEPARRRRISQKRGRVKRAVSVKRRSR